MKNLKKIDEQDFVFINTPLSASEDKEFSDFLKKRKSKMNVKRNERTSRTARTPRTLA